METRSFSCRRGDLVLDVLEGGPQEGEAVLLLHGFPQDATAWDGVAPLLHEAGLRTLAPHQRGYSPGARPRRARDYRMRELVTDALAVLDAAGVARAHVVGHDWGGFVARVLAAAHPDRVASLVVLSTPHPRALRESLRHGDQARRSWYVLAFQVPLLPEHLLARALRRGGLRRTGLPAAADQGYAERLRRADALRGPVHWYRAALRPEPGRRRRRGPGGDDASRDATVTVPTTYLWGGRDPFLGREAAERTGRYVSADYRFVECGAGHWLPEREPGLVARMVLERVRP
ncbi:alpha/beta fold hydrolase [Ornithinimicrobium humiphilum]|uniref:Pimeloyl-ACP methyl ester carboxylesterase n=1 Tax=Ornithinimicrobium humiphilum TaxID=125288 RepID=A0A543KN91_9MICO|nr:alpha/beta fold hydrolase [Ornithinimicrobium humiphilum]TQM96548.1 pimeloyl-ACP methyl ester carboxylesterase [Ornithinimicrobium humiphilum]